MPLICTCRVANVARAGSASVAPLTARTPAGTVTVTSVDPGKRAPAVVNVRTRGSVHRHVPATAGAIVAGGFATTPTSATGTIASENRIRTSESVATSPSGEICGGASGTTCTIGAIGASPTALPVGATNAIG